MPSLNIDCNWKPPILTLPICCFTAVPYPSSISIWSKIVHFDLKDISDFPNGAVKSKDRWKLFQFNSLNRYMKLWGILPLPKVLSDPPAMSISACKLSVSSRLAACTLEMVIFFPFHADYVVFFFSFFFLLRRSKERSVYHCRI